MEHSHKHGHAHSHSHDHIHTAEGLCAEDKVRALLGYMISHNGSHMEEYRALAAQVEETGHPDLAARVYECVDLYMQIDSRLKEVLDHFKEDH